MCPVGSLTYVLRRIETCILKVHPLGRRAISLLSPMVGQEGGAVVDNIVDSPVVVFNGVEHVRRMQEINSTLLVAMVYRMSVQ